MFAHYSSWFPHSVIIALKNVFQALIWRQETLTAWPSCQIMNVNYYHKKNVTDPLDIRQSGIPAESKSNKCNQAKAALDCTTLSFTTDDTIRSEQIVFPSLLHSSRFSQFYTRLLDIRAGSLSASLSTLVQERAWPVSNLSPL